MSEETKKPRRKPTYAVNLPKPPSAIEEAAIEEAAIEEAAIEEAAIEEAAIEEAAIEEVFVSPFIEALCIEPKDDEEQQVTPLLEIAIAPISFESLPPIGAVSLMQGLIRTKEEKNIRGSKWIVLDGRLGFIPGMKYKSARNKIALVQDCTNRVYFAVHTSLPRFPSPIPQQRGSDLDLILNTLL